MDGAKEVAPNYVAIMANATWVGEEQPDKEQKVRLSPELLSALKRIAAVETILKRQARPNAGRTTLNKLLQSATEMFVAAWIEDWGELPSDEKEDAARTALLVGDKRAKMRARTESAQHKKK